MLLADRKLQELTNKLTSLRTELDYWMEISELSKPFEKHCSQIRRIRRILLPCQEGVERRLATIAASPEALLAGCQDIERMALEIQRIWEYFRNRLVQRDQLFFRLYLQAADALAWECYEAMRTRSVNLSDEEKKEPPLVFMNGSISPFALPRNWAFFGEFVPYEQVSTRIVLETMRSLPVPTLGLPWSQAGHLPDILCLAHEVGHLVSFDFLPTDRILQRIAVSGVPANHLHAWSSWAEEVFADIYGTLASGPAFVSTLMDFLVSSPEIIRNETQPTAKAAWSTYPTSALRVLLCLHLLECIEQQFPHQKIEEGKIVSHRYETPEGDQMRPCLPDLRAQWTELYPEHAMRTFEADIPLIVTALLGPYEEIAGQALGRPLFHSQGPRNCVAGCGGQGPTRRGAERRHRTLSARIGTPRL